MIARIGIVIGFVAALGGSAMASDWPQFLGPNRDGIAWDAKGLSRVWPATGPKSLWRVSVGIGYGAPAVFGESILLLDREENARDVLRRVDINTGKDIWRYAYDAPGKLQHNGSRSTPATDGQLVFTIGPFGDMKAVKFADGALVWSKNILTDFDAKSPQWGVSTAPLLMGDWVIFAPWGTKAALVACEKQSGKIVWTTPNTENIVEEYSSPVPMTFNGKSMIVSCGRRGYMIGADAQTGQLLWSYTGFPKKGWLIPSPTILPDGRIFLTGGYGCGGDMIQLVQQGNDYKIVELWKNMNMASKTGQALFYKGYIYGSASDIGGGLRCLTPDGEIKWDSEKSGDKFGLGNLLIADDLIFIMNGDDGRVTMAEASPKEYKKLGELSLLSPGEDWAPLVICGGKLLIRDERSLICLDLPVAP